MVWMVRMEHPELNMEIAGIEFRNPLLLASGIADETGSSMAQAVLNGAGGVVTKSLSLAPREGHRNPCIVDMTFGLINAMGLPNPGIEEYAKEIRTFREEIDAPTPVIGSVFGSTIDEYGLAAKEVQGIGVDAVEINGSCPNAKGLGMQFGQDPAVIDELVREVKVMVDIPVFFKLTPATSNIVDLAVAAQDAGADGLVAVNTMPAMKIDIRTRRSHLTNVTGGLSGPALRPIGVRCVHQLASSGEIDIPIIGVGGIMNHEDALEYLMAGARAVQIGTAVTWRDLKLFGEIASDLERFLKSEGVSSITDLVGSVLEVSG
ncbi:MAG: dihydroorotate dehydrogenase [Candidatus Thermoplasmatota archaeon]|nr:dihydroorotate dehydrogenase [Candidatus Thermoplasmatota archaeon]